MKTYQAVKAEIAKLEAKAESLRKAELKSVIAQVRKTIAEYDLSAADLGLGRGAPRAKAGRKARSQGVAKYRDPKSGQTWTGRGRPPAWIADAKDRDAFLIAPAAGTAAKAPAAKKRKGPAARKARPAAKRKVATATRKKAAKARKPRASTKSAAVQIESGNAMQ